MTNDFRMASSFTTQVQAKQTISQLPLKERIVTKNQQPKQGNQNKNQQAKPKSKYTVKVAATGLTPGQPAIARALVLEGAKPLKDVPITFLINGDGIPGEFQTDTDGYADVYFDVKKDSTNVTIKAIAALEGKPYDELPVNFGAILAADNKNVKIMTESLYLGNGEWRYYIALVFDDDMNFPTTGTIVVVPPKKRLEVTDSTKKPKIHTREFEITFTEPKGRVFYFKTMDPGMYEVDMMPESNPTRKEQLQLPGTKEGPIRGGESFSEKLFQGFF